MPAKPVDDDPDYTNDLTEDAELAENFDQVNNPEKIPADLGDAGPAGVNGDTE